MEPSAGPEHIGALYLAASIGYHRISMDDHGKDQTHTALTEALSGAMRHAKAMFDKVGSEQPSDFYEAMTASISGLADGLQIAMAAANAAKNRGKNLTLTPGGDVLMLTSVASARLIEEGDGAWYLSCLTETGTVLAEWECESKIDAKMDALRVRYGKRMAIEQGQAPGRLRDIEVVISDSPSAAGAN
jgi:hypothetical protein